ncbi:MAG: alpha-glucosidase [Eubacterium sp.]|nr:alpha-glucosidase [Eubacterium sp.]
MSILERLEDAELALWAGENHFTMSRGSFVYLRDIRGIKLLKRVDAIREEGCLRLVYEGLPELVVLEMREGEDGLVRVSLRDGLPAGYSRCALTIPALPEEHIYGCGEIHRQLDLKGEKVRIWVAEHQNTVRIGRKLLRRGRPSYHYLKREEKPFGFSSYESYYAQPTFVSSEKYFVHVDTDRFCQFDFRKKETILILQDAPRITIGTADSFEALSEKLTGLLGRQPSLPDWIYDGAVLAVQGGTATVQEKIDRSLAAGVPVAGIWSQDWCGCRRTGFGYQVMWNWEWDQELYPELPEKIAEWKAQGIRFLGYINPFLALEGDLYKEAAAKGYCVKNRKGDDYLVTITTFPAAMVDFTNPEAYAWYKEIIRKNMIGIGLSGWMADFGEYLPVDSVLFSGEDPYEIHNRWPAIWAAMNREVIRECGMEDEILFFTRAGHTGTLKASGMMWTGDQHVDWTTDDGMPSVIPATLSLAMSGFGITHSDAGGYTTMFSIRRSPELLMRWEEMDAFTPMLRTHEGNQPVNNAQFDDDETLLAHMAKCAGWFRALKPYLVSLERENCEKGTPVMRPLFYHYDEPAAYGEVTEYLLGRDLLVAPVLKPGAESRSVYLPADSWKHVFTGEYYEGGTFEVAAPIGQPAVFIRRGSEWEGLLDGFLQAETEETVR